MESKESVVVDQEGADQQKVDVEEQSSASNGDVDDPKHPLMHAWTLWHYKNDPRLQWDANLVKVYTFRYCALKLIHTTYNFP